MVEPQTFVDGTIQTRNDECDCEIRVIDVSNAEVNGVAIPWFLLSNEDPATFGGVNGEGNQTFNELGQLGPPPGAPKSFNVGEQSLALAFELPVGITIDDLPLNFSITISVTCKVHTDNGTALSIMTHTFSIASASGFGEHTDQNGSTRPAFFFNSIDFSCDRIVASSTD